MSRAQDRAEIHIVSAISHLAYALRDPRPDTCSFGKALTDLAGAITEYASMNPDFMTAAMRVQDYYITNNHGSHKDKRANMGHPIAFRLEFVPLADVPPDAHGPEYYED